MEKSNLATGGHIHPLKNSLRDFLCPSRTDRKDVLHGGGGRDLLDYQKPHDIIISEKKDGLKVVSSDGRKVGYFQ